MKKFNFSLEKVLDFKQQTLDILKSELASLQLKLRAIDKQIEEMNARFSSFNLQMRSEMQRGLSPNDISVYKIYLSTLNTKTQIMKENRKRLSAVIAQKEQEVLTVKSSISGLEKLRDKQRDEYDRAAQKLQEITIEEFVSQVRSRKMTAHELA